MPYIATAPDGHPEFLDTIAERLVAFRERQNRKTAEDLIHEDFDPANPVDLTDGPGRLSNIFDIEARIRAANASVVEGKRITFIQFYRLYNEDTLVAQWKALGYTSFQVYTHDHLGVGSEAYAFAKIGFALIKFRHFIAELPNRDSEDLFPKLPFIEAALKTYKGDYLAIRHALIRLSPADFKDFALNADFVERQFREARDRGPARAGVFFPLHVDPQPPLRPWRGDEARRRPRPGRVAGRALDLRRDEGGARRRPDSRPGRR